MHETIYRANLVYDAQASLGEGPVWDPKNQLLYWVDIENGALHCYDPKENTHKHWCFGEMLGAAVPAESGKMLLALETGMASYDLKSNKLERLPVLENGDTNMRFNDCKVGPNGHLWIGTMHKKFVGHAGKLYRMGPDLKASAQIDGTTISNGMDWDRDQNYFYYIDSPTHQVLVFDYDNATGSIANGTIAFKIPENLGTPDGMCIDKENMLWIAHWGGNCVRRWNPNNGEILQEISVPAPQVTSCCFGGPNFDTLYITSARGGLTASELEKFPKSGGLFSFTPHVPGGPIDYFKDL